MNFVRFEAIEDDIKIVLSHEREYYEIFLSQCIEHEINESDVCICKTIAIDFYKIIQNLELMAFDMRQKYVEWKKNDFE